MKLKVLSDMCIGCGACQAICPDCFEVNDDGVAEVIVEEVSEDVIRIQAELPALETFASQDERDPDTVVRDVTTTFQGIDTNVETLVVVDTLTNGVDVASVNVVEVGAESKLVPMQFMKIFNEFGGVYMLQVSWDVRTRVWSYEVIIYAK